LSTSRFVYNQTTLRLDQAEKCTQCCECEPKCPQHIEISEWMPQVHAVLGGMIESDK
jgi:predicted aldo/keto reductase-like oxidoreductase